MGGPGRPGRTHTLYSDDQDRVMETVDVFWFINHYETYCRENGVPIDQRLCL